MENQLFVFDYGLFVEKNEIHLSLPESYETISNLLKTIKEYRDYSSPNPSMGRIYSRNFPYFQDLRQQNLRSSDRSKRYRDNPFSKSNFRRCHARK